MSREDRRRLVITGVPIDSVSAPEPGSEPFGTELAPVALRAAGLASAVAAADAGDLPVRLSGRVRDTQTGVVGWPAVRALTQAVRLQASEITAGGRVPFLVGGCCTLLPGALAGARDALGQVGLAYLDGHLDTYDGQTSPTGEAADMPSPSSRATAPRTGQPRSARRWSAPISSPCSAPATALRPQTLGAVLPEDCGLRRELSPAQLRDRGLSAAGQDAAERLAGPAAGTGCTSTWTC